jgi:hypothetical protein
VQAPTTYEITFAGEYPQTGGVNRQSEAESEGFLAGWRVSSCRGKPPRLTGTATSLLDGILSSYDLAKEVGEMIDLTFTDPSLAKLSEENSNGYQ